MRKKGTRILRDERTQVGSNHAGTINAHKLAAWEGPKTTAWSSGHFLANPREGATNLATKQTQLEACIVDAFPRYF